MLNALFVNTKNICNKKVISVLFASAFLFSACSSTKLDEKPAVDERASSSTNSGNSGADTGSVATIDATSSSNNANANELTGLLAKRSIYFDYDSYSVKDDFKPMLDAHAKYLGNNKNRKIVIQGNTDERGGREYNLALGQKRAEAVRKSLSLLGVPDTQMEAVSFGKEKPKATASDEAAWAENRRADIVY